MPQFSARCLVFVPHRLSLCDRKGATHIFIVLQLEADVDRFSLNEWSIQLHQHDVHATWGEFDLFAWRDGQVGNGTHCCAIALDPRFME